MFVGVCVVTVHICVYTVVISVYIYTTCRCIHCLCRYIHCTWQCKHYVGSGYICVLFYRVRVMIRTSTYQSLWWGCLERWQVRPPYMVILRLMSSKPECRSAIIPAVRVLVTCTTRYHTSRTSAYYVYYALINYCIPSLIVLLLTR